MLRQLFLLFKANLKYASNASGGERLMNEQLGKQPAISDVRFVAAL